MSVQLRALAEEVFEAAAALDLVMPTGMRTVTALAPAPATADSPSQAQVAMVQVFTPDLGTVVPSLRAGEGVGGGLTIVPVQDEHGWAAFEGLLRADAVEHGRSDDATAHPIDLYRWQAANTPHRFYLARDGDRAVARVALFQHRTSAYLHSLFTHPGFRRRGAGSFLIQAMDAEARAGGGDRVGLICPRDSWLPAYFERLGFRVVGEQQR